MQENEFEKKLQQKLELLQVQPAGEVWEKVKREVAEKKRKKRFAFFFLTGCVLLVGLFLSNTLNLFNDKQAKPVADAVIKLKKKTTDINKVSNEKLSAAIETTEQNKNVSVEMFETTPLKKANENISDNNYIYNNSIVAENEESLKQRSLIKRKTGAKTKVKTVSILPEDDDYRIETSAITSLQNEKEQIAAIAGKEIENKTIALNETDKSIDSKIEETKTNEPQSQTAKTVKTKKEEKNKKSKWGIGLSFSGGVSSTRYNNMDKSIAFESDGLGSTPTGPTAGANTYYPSVANSGFGFNAGVQVYRIISNRMKLTTGLQYSIYSTSQKTGDIVVSQYNSVTNYRYGATNTYKNKYHYLSLPIGTSIHLFDIAKREINVEAGVNFSRLIKTNTLAFDTSAGNYYYNQSLLSRTFVGFSASLTINLAANSKRAFYIGPEFYYSITPLSKSGMYANTHSRYIGLKLQKNLTK